MPSLIRTRLRPASELAEGTIVSAGDDHAVQVDHGEGARSRYELDTRCAIRRSRTRPGSRPIVIDLGTGAAWFDGNAGAVFEIRRPGVTVVAGLATLAVTGEPDGSTTVVVVNGTATVEPDGSPPQELARQAAVVSADGRLRDLLALTPSDLASDPWVVANRLLDAEQHQSPERPTDEEEPAPRPRTVRAAALLAAIAALAIGAGAALVAGLGGDDDQVATGPPTQATVTTGPPTGDSPTLEFKVPPDALPRLSETKVTSCRRSRGQVAFSGTLTNHEAVVHTYRLAVRFSDADGQVVERKTTDLEVPAGGTAPWTVVSTEGDRLGSGRCDHEQTTRLP